MDVEPALAGVLFLLLAFMVALTAGAEVALASVSRSQVRQWHEKGVPRSALLSALLDNPTRFLSALTMAKSAGFVGAGVLVAWFALAREWTLLLLVTVWLLTWAALMGFQVLGRALSLRQGEQAALNFAPLIHGLTTLLAPLAGLWQAMGGRVSGELSGLGQESLFLDEEGLRLLRHLADREVTMDEDEKQMIAGIFDLGETAVREVMVPRIDMVAIPSHATLQEAIQVILEKGHSRIPVYTENVDRIVGLLYAKDLLRCFQSDCDQDTVAGLLRPVYYVPESKKIDDLFNEMRRRQVHIAIVVDEYGGTAGLVTIEDLLEEIVGEIRDEYDTEEPILQQLGPDRFIFNARMPLDDVSELLDTELEAENVDTLGGFIYSQLGHVPEAGETVEWEGWRFTVLSVVSRRIEKVRVERLESPTSSSAMAPSSSTADADQEAGTSTSSAASQSSQRSKGWSILGLLF